MIKVSGVSFHFVISWGANPLVMTIAMAATTDKEKRPRIMSGSFTCLPGTGGAHAKVRAVMAAAIGKCSPFQAHRSKNDNTIKATGLWQAAGRLPLKSTYKGYGRRWGRRDEGGNPWPINGLQRGPGCQF